MNKVLSILIAAAFASVSFAAVGADDPAKAARKQVNDTYKADKKACDALKGKEERDCNKQAKAKRDQARAEAKAMKKSEKPGKASSGSSTAPSSSSTSPSYNTSAPSSSDASRGSASDDKAAPATTGSSVK